MRPDGLLGRLTIVVGLLTSGIVVLVALAMAGLVYLQTEREIKRDLSRAAFSIIRDELTSSRGSIRLQKQDGGESLADLLRNLDISLYVADASGSALAAYGIYRTISTEDHRELLGSFSGGQLPYPVYTDKHLSQIGRVDTYTAPLLEGNTSVGLLQLTRVNNMWPIIGKSLIFAVVLMIPIIWLITVLGSRWGTMRTLAPLSELVSSVSILDTDRLPDHLRAPHAMDHDVSILHKTLQTLISRVRDTLRRQREISENLSHEFKTPLTRIASRLGVLSAALPQKQRQDLLDPAIRELVELGEQVDGLLDVAMYGSFQGEGRLLRIKPFIANLIAHIKSGKQTIVLDIPDQFEVMIPPGHARIIFRNLLENAVKYAPQGSEIVISTQETGTKWGITVANVLDPKTPIRGDIFKRKYRESEGLVSGYGLGLAIVHDVAKQLGLVLRYQTNQTTIKITISNQ